jgi:hypothetical protein
MDVHFAYPSPIHRSTAMDEKQLAKLVRKTTDKVAKAKAGPRPTYDKTLDITRRPETAQDVEAAELFQQMKKREF